MFRWVLALGAAMAAAGCSSTGPWSRTEQAMFAMNVGCHAVDYAQTEWAMDHGYTELNPFMGESPSPERIAATKVGTQALVYAIADAYEDRTFMLAMTLLPCLATIGHNYAQGARP